MWTRTQNWSLFAESRSQTADFRTGRTVSDGAGYVLDDGYIGGFEYGRSVGGDVICHQVLKRLFRGGDGGAAVFFIYFITILVFINFELYL